MKKLLSLVLCLVLLLTTCTALAEMSEWGAKVKAASDGKTITVAMASHPSTEAFKTMSDKFTELTGIKVVWDIVEETNLKSKQLLDWRLRRVHD